MKKIMSLLLALVLMLSCSISVLADEAAEHVITITNEKAGHVYEAGDYLLTLSVEDIYSSEQLHPLMRNFCDRQSYVVEFSIP